MEEKIETTKTTTTEAKGEEKVGAVGPKNNPDEAKDEKKPNLLKTKEKTKAKPLTSREKAVKTLQAVCRASKGVHLSNNGYQIIADETHEVKCAICKYAAKVTMPLPHKQGVKPCEGNRHMSWIPFDHPTLGDIFKRRLATKKSMHQFENDAYGGPSPARAKMVLGVKKGKDPKASLIKVEEKLKALLKQKTELKKALTTKKAVKKAVVNDLAAVAPVVTK